MRRILTRILPEEFFQDAAHTRAFILAMVYLFLIVTQLFTFEKYAAITLGYGLPGGQIGAGIMAGLIPLLEIAALPGLLSMKLTPMWRTVSQWCAVLVGVLWAVLGIWLSIKYPQWGGESGLLGATFPTASGLWMVLFGALLALAAYLTKNELPKRK